MQHAPKKIAISNQKGGVGKTTTTINLAAALSELDRSVLVVDLDPQGNASTGLGVSLEDRDVTSSDLLLGTSSVEAAFQKTQTKNLFIVPCDQDLSSIDMELFEKSDRSHVLAKAMNRSDLSAFDYVLFDCPPSLSLLTINALVAADSVLVPLQSEFFALEGLSQLLKTIKQVRQSANPNLRIEGVLLTMMDRRNRLAQMVEQDARENLGDLVFETTIPRNVRISEAPSFAESVLTYDPKSKGSLAYRSLAVEILEKEGDLA